MATATFLDFASFKSHTSVALPRYYILRSDNTNVLRVMGVNETSGVSHIYTMDPDEDLVPTGLGADAWFTGAIKVQDFTG